MEQVQVHQVITEVTVSVLPIEPGTEQYDVSVVWQHDDRYTVEHDDRFCTPAGTWERHAGRDRDGPFEAWVAAHEYSYFEALGLARQVCQTITVGGLTAAEVLAKGE